MTKGYQLIESTCLVGFMERKELDVFTVSICYWLIRRLEGELSAYLQNIDLEVIRVTNFGSYPALGIHYRDIDPLDIGQIIEAAIERIVKESTVSELIQFVGDAEVSWAEMTARIMDGNAGVVVGNPSVGTEHPGD